MSCNDLAARPPVKESTTPTRKIEVYAARHGDDFLKAVRQVGPRTFHLVEEAGTHGNQAVRALARHGEHKATWVVSRSQGHAAVP